MRRRGFTPTSINNFCREIGITRNDNIIPMHKLEHHIRSDLDATSPRTLAVLKPLKVRGFSLKSSSTAQNSKLLLPFSHENWPYFVEDPEESLIAMGPEAPLEQPLESDDEDTAWMTREHPRSCPESIW